MGVLVVIRREQDCDQWTAALDAAGIAWSGFASLRRIFRVEGVTVETFPLRAHAGVESVEPDDLPIRGADQSISIDASLSGGSWSIARVIRRDPPWPIPRLRFPLDTYFRCVRDGAGVDFYSFDTGILTTHDEFGGRATNVYEAVSSGGLGDDNGHGTGTASCGCGSTVGLARGALLWSFKCLDSANTGTNTRIINSISEALTHYAGRSGTNRPAVANMSIVGAGSAINTAVADMIDAGLVVVACAGNTGEDLGTIAQFPAESDADVIVVGGIGAADIPYYDGAGSSNWGTRIDVSAPSQSIYRANAASDSSYNGASVGTSFGCGYVSGAVACMLQGHSRLADRTDVQAVRTHVMSTASTGKISNTFGITLPDRLIYLDPDQAAPETITGL